MTNPSAPSASTPSAPSMQEVILRLQRYWSERGAMVVQPFNTEVGAGTANPATALRVLGPEPWNVAYVEPSVRPDDSRYGENPNRLQTHTQFQVILKPAPADPQEAYLASLEALGIDLDAHDVRFVEDNWASPALGAWGLGWEVWLDGMEITQFTYFQQAGGITLDPVAVEITYGLERIVMALQGVAHFKDIRYTDDVTYGEVFGQAEYEMSRYYLDDADVDLNRSLFESYAAEARRMLDLSLPVPAYSYVLKCSHTFNVLDARGAISTTERARSFALMRRLTHAVSSLWVERRAELEHPLGLVEPAPAASVPELPAVTGTHDLLVEIGLEELPHADVVRAVEQVRDAATEHLDAARLGHGAVTVRSTPRRVVVTVADVAEKAEDLTRTVRGPRVSAAHDASGEPTKALLGFLRSRGAELDAVERVTDNGVEYVAVQQHVPGLAAPEVVAELVDRMVRALHAEKNMRWGDPELSYSRPVRWLLVLLGGTVLEVGVSALRSGSTTRVLRRAETPEQSVTSVEDYEQVLATGGIVLDREERRRQVVEGAQALAARAGGRVDVDAESALVDEITDLTEAPNVLLGRFEERYLDLPAAVLTTVMRKHQRYLPVVDADGALLPCFVIVANGPCDPDVVRAGNESVIRARYEDASFFWRADLEVSPEQFRARLDQLTFETTLGSFDQRVRRIARLAETVARACGLGDADLATVRRAAELGKFDLATQMVVELSSLAGTMAREYAQRAGEPAAVAQALAEMEMPRTSLSAAPESLAGAVLSVADRLDLVTAMSAIGAMPTGASDPFGVRRAALGLIRVLRERPGLEDVSVGAGIAAAADLLSEQGVEVSDAARAAAVDLVVQRYSTQLLDAGHDVQVVRAVLPGADRPALADRRVAELEAVVATDDGRAVVAALQRAIRILPGPAVQSADGAASHDASPDDLDPAERELASVVDTVERGGHGGHGGVAQLVEASTAAGLPAAVEAFFDSVQVMHPDPAVRARRLALVTRVARLGGDSVSWVALEK